ncbi:DUF1573 domain-containing protein [Luteibaculum oceani]|uniref:DUF1573 domain-containing protein n=1 Tax=Luteibaculum oceani TaxID=1294296 RepID=A0A5C6UWK6_9FLAO|nr:DUF1573 domain-containing protein [Luteibaculum oceani]TXC77044.1 DUF1573 domain-containing protein [Luteibaculum oceani]
MNKENIKIGLLAIIALVLVVDTFVMDDEGGSYQQSTSQPKSNLVANNPNLPTSNLVNPPVEEEPESNLPTTVMSFGEMTHDFGTIKQDTENKKIFTFTNTGSEPLVISNAVGSCGCTVPAYPKEPIAPGETGEIEVVYKPGKQKGQQSKTVTITANTEPKTTRLSISANVEEV